MSAVSPELMGTLSQASSALLAYTDDTTPTLNGSIIGVSLIGTTAALVVLFSLLSKNLASKSFAFELTEQESAAVNGSVCAFDFSPCCQVARSLTSPRPLPPVRCNCLYVASVRLPQCERHL